ncbi:MAG: Mur ligase family protein [Pirellulaceae bacterium]
MRHAIVSSKFLSSKNASSKEAPSLSDALAADAKWLKCNPPQLDAVDANSLKDILPNAEFFSGDDVKFTGIADNVQSAQPGDLVVYRIGECDPMELAATAMARGAAGIVTEQMLPCPLPQCIVGDVELAMAKIASGLLGRPDHKLLTIGVVGSAGKTTTSLLISSLLRGGGTRTAYQTDLGDCDGIVQSTPSTTLPTGCNLVQWLGEAVDGQCQAAVIELADQDARHGKYDAMQFDILVITGTAPLSSDFGPSGLQCLLEHIKPTGVVVAPIDDERGIQVVRDSGCRMVTYGMKRRADLNGKIVESSCGMSTMSITEGDTTALLETALCGAANAANHLAAASVGMLIDQPLQQVVQSLSSLRAVPARGQRLSDFQHATAILDVAGTPERASAAMHTARSMKAGGQLWCVLAINENDSPETLAHYGQLLERYSNKAIVTCPRSMKASFLSATHHLLDGVQHCAAMRLVADPQRAVAWAVSEAKPSDTILVLGGVDTSNAHQQRTDIQELKGWVDTQREMNEAVAKSTGNEVELRNPSILPIRAFKN